MRAFLLVLLKFIVAAVPNALRISERACYFLESGLIFTELTVEKCIDH